MKRLLGLLLSLVLIISSIASVDLSAYAETEYKISIGDYITLGTYYGEPIVWRCVGIDDNGPLMLSDKILCYKAFDGKGNHNNGYRNNNGTNNWERSGIRHWLNSIGEVNWEGQEFIPSENNVYNGYNSYDNELGFLTNFTESELGLIKTVSQKTYLNNLDRTLADGGSSRFDFNANNQSFSSFFNELETKTSGKWYSITNDTIFLLGPEQAKLVYDNFGSGYLNASATPQAIANDTSGKSYERYWLRLPCNTGMSYENVALIDHGTIYHAGANCLNGFSYVNSVGVRPAFYLDTTKDIESALTYKGIVKSDSVSENSNNFYVYDSVSLLNSVNAYYGSKSHSFSENISVLNTELVDGIKFTKSGYNDYIIPREVVNDAGYLSTLSHNIYMASNANDGKPYISTVFAKDLTTSNDNNVSGYVETQHEVLTIKSGSKYNVIISANLAGNSNATYYLSQDNQHKISNDSGYFTSEELYSVFKENSTIYAYVVAGGQTSEPVKLKLIKKASSELDNLLQTSTFNLLGEDAAKVSIGNDIPIIGGSNFSFDFIKLPMGVQVQNDIVRISLGVDVFSSKLNNGNVELTNGLWENFKKECQSFNKAIKNTSDKWKTYKKWMGISQFGSVSPVTNKNNAVSAGVMGYIEGQIVNGKIQVISYSGTVAADFILSCTTQFTVGPVPVYAYAQGGSDLSLEFSAAKLLNDDNIPFDFGLNLSANPNLKGGGGVGVKSAASAGIYMKASLPIINNFSSKYRSIYLNGSIGVEAELFCFKANKDLLNGSKVIYDGYYGTQSKSLQESIALFGINSLIENNNDKTVFTSMDRDYAKETSAWLGDTLNNSKFRLRAETQQSTDIKTLQSSVYKNSKSQIVKFGEKMMMVWVEDCDSRNDNNRLRLVYSVYDNSLGVWSEPKAVFDDGKLDNSPTLVTDGTKVYVAWQKCNSEINDNEDINANSLLSDIEICYAEYDEENDSFVNVQTVTDNDTYDYSPTLFAGEDGVTLYYINNNLNDLSGLKANTIYKWKNGLTSTKVVSELNYVANIDVSDNEISYSTDIDGDLNTTSDIEIFTVKNGTNIQISNKQSSANLVMKYGIIDNEKTLFFADNTNLYYYKNNEIHSVFNEERTINGDLNIMNNDNCTVLIWSEITDFGTDIYTCKYENGVWSVPIQLTDTDSLISDISSVIYQDKIYAVFDKTERILQDDDTYENGLTDLCLLISGEKTDLGVSIEYIDESDFIAGETSKINVTVENFGTETISNADFILTDAVATYDVQNKSINLASGESTIVTLEYTVPAEISFSDLTVEVICDNDENIENNSSSYSIGNTDLKISDMMVEYVDGYYNVTGIIHNDSMINAENISVDIRLRDSGSDVINTLNIGDIAAREKYVISYIVSAESMNFGEDDTEENIYFSVVTSTKEKLTENNTAGICVEAPHIHTFSNEWTIKTPASCSNNGVEENICDVCEETVLRDIPPTNDHDYQFLSVEYANNQKITTFKCSVCEEISTIVLDCETYLAAVQKANEVKINGLNKYDCNAVEAFEISLAEAKNLADSAKTFEEMETATTMILNAISTLNDNLINFTVTYITDVNGEQQSDIYSVKYGELFTSPKFEKIVSKITYNNGVGTTELPIDECISFTVLEDATVTVYESNEEKTETNKYTKVTLLSNNGAVYAVGYVPNGTVIDCNSDSISLNNSTISAPIIAFYKFVCWDVISGNVSNADGSDIVLKAKYNLANLNNICNIIGIDGVLVNGNSSYFAYYDEKISITAPNGKNLAYTDSTGSEIISYLKDNVMFTPNCENIYIKEVDGDVEAKTAILGTYNENSRAGFNCQFSLPENSVFVECGVIITMNGDIANNNFVIGETGVSKFKSNSQSLQNEFSLSLKYSDSYSGKILYGRSYLIYKNENGESQTVYSDLNNIQL